MWQTRPSSFIPAMITELALLHKGMKMTSSDLGSAPATRVKCGRIPIHFSAVGPDATQ